jgi:hypothetical protein
LRRKVEREARLRAAAAKAARKAEERARRAAAEPAQAQLVSPAAKQTRKTEPAVRPSAAELAQASSVSPEPTPMTPKHKKKAHSPGRQPKPKRHHDRPRQPPRTSGAVSARAGAKPKPGLTASSPIVLLSLFALVAGLIVYLALR